MKESLDPLLTIKTKIHQEVKRPKRLNEEKKDEGDPVIAYPEFKRPMFEPLRDLWEDLVFPGIKHIPQNSIGILETNQIFINSYMVGLNHEMAKELLWREYRTDQRGSYFRQFWDASAAVEREKLEHFQKTGHLPSPDQDKEIIEKYLDIPEIHRWKDSSLDRIQEENVRPPAVGAGAVLQADRQVLLIRGELLMRFPNAVIYAVKAKSDNTNNKKPVLPTPEEEFRLVLQKDIKEPVFRGSIPPDITFLGFDIPLEDLLGNDVNADPGYFFIIQEQPSEPRFGIDVPVDSTVDPASLESWNDLDWNYFTPALASLGHNNYIDLENALLKGKKIGKVTWGNHAADLAYILMQQPVRIAVHARELLKNLKNGEQ